MPNRHAANGTNAHELAEKVLRWSLANNWGEYPDYGEETEIVSAVRVYVAAINDFYKYLFSSAPDVKIEASLILDDDLNLWGTADCAMTGQSLTGELLGIIVDLKYGKTPVRCKDNPQLAYYACALKNTSKKKLSSVITAVIQPRASRNIIQTITYSTADLVEWRDKLLLGASEASIQALQPKNRQLKAGSWCKYCLARNICPERNPPPGEGEGLEFLDVE